MGDSLRGADDVTLQLFQRTFNQCNGQFTLSKHAMKPAPRRAEVLRKMHIRRTVVEDARMGRLAKLL